MPAGAEPIRPNLEHPHLAKGGPYKKGAKRCEARNAPNGRCGGDLLVATSGPSKKALAHLGHVRSTLDTMADGLAWSTSEPQNLRIALGGFVLNDFFMLMLLWLVSTGPDGQQVPMQGWNEA